LPFCGGSGQKPKTEPEAPLERPETPKNPKPQTPPQPETLPEKEIPEEVKVKENKVIPMEREFIPEEKLPVIKPLQPKTPEMPKQPPLTDALNTGIVQVFNNFGYKGNLEVPGSFKKRIAHYIRYFSEDTKGARFFRRAMNRGSKYIPMIKEILKKKHLPESLAFLPVIESGFNLTTRSRAGAVGMWQFMRGTARMYGLKVNRYKDDRKDPIKSTYAAAEYLNDLLAMFGQEDPFLGISAYNAGEGKILRALRQISFKDRSFWTLVKNNLLKHETDEYIPRLIAVILITQDSAKYTLASKDINVSPNEEEDLEIIASLHSSKDNLGEESQEKEAEKEEITLKKVKPKPTISAKPPAYTRYKVKRGDTLYRIARRHGVSVGRLKKWNNIRRNKIYPGQKLKIYGGSSPSTKQSPKSSSGKYRLVYTVNYTDSLARIALFFKGVSARDIMNWNHLRRTRIHPRQKLTLFLKKPPRKVLTHVVKRGDTARKIARRYRLRLEYVLSLNGLVTNSRLKPGQHLRIYYF
jgi:membrane-bound lytic murein transglycosylase D